MVIDHLPLDGINNTECLPEMLDWLSEGLILIIDEKHCFRSRDRNIEQLQFSADFRKLTEYIAELGL